MLIPARAASDSSGDGADADPSTLIGGCLVAGAPLAAVDPGGLVGGELEPDANAATGMAMAAAAATPAMAQRVLADMTPSSAGSDACQSSDLAQDGPSGDLRSA